MNFYYWKNIFYSSNIYKEYKDDYKLINLTKNEGAGAVLEPPDRRSKNRRVWRATTKHGNQKMFYYLEEGKSYVESFLSIDCKILTEKELNLL